MAGEEWIPEESAIALYFIARRAVLSGELAKALIKLRCARERTPSACTSRVHNLRKSMPKDPYNEASGRYDLDIVDTWLSGQFTKKRLEELFGLKDNKIVDEEVLEIMARDHIGV